MPLLLPCPTRRLRKNVRLPEHSRGWSPASEDRATGKRAFELVLSIAGLLGAAVEFSWEARRSRLKSRETGQLDAAKASHEAYKRSTAKIPLVLFLN
jgi:hypothetical protein